MRYVVVGLLLTGWWGYFCGTSFGNIWQTWVAMAIGAFLIGWFMASLKEELQ